MISLDVAATYAGFRDLTLPKAAWTHEAHLAVCWMTLQTSTVDAAIGDLRAAIRTYNEATNTPNTDTGGYHETLTRYYVGAVAHSGAVDVATVFADPACSRNAPLEHWSPDRLMSVAARRGWVDPDLLPLPFTPPTP